MVVRSGGGRLHKFEASLLPLLNFPNTIEPRFQIVYIFFHIGEFLVYLLAQILPNALANGKLDLVTPSFRLLLHAAFDHLFDHTAEGAK